MTKALVVTCPRCHAQYRIGHDSAVTTPLDTLEVMGNVIFTSNRARMQFMSMPHIVGRAEHPDHETRERLLDGARLSIKRVADAQSKGMQPKWYCDECRDPNIAEPYPLA